MIGTLSIASGLLLACSAAGRTSPPSVEDSGASDVEAADKNAIPPDGRRIPGQPELCSASSLGLSVAFNSPEARATAVTALIATVDAPAEDVPIDVRRRAITALGCIGDPQAIPSLLTVVLRIPDNPATLDVFNRSAIAIASMREDAVPAILTAIRGEDRAINALATDAGLDQSLVETIYGQFAGVTASPATTPALLAVLPTADCRAPAKATASRGSGKAEARAASKSDGKTDELSAEAVSLRMTIARQLGLTAAHGDQTAVQALCGCAMASGSFDQFEIAQALSRIGGDQAYDCLLDMVRGASYADDAVASPEYRYEIRWEAARFAILAAPANRIDEVEKTLASSSEEIVRAKSAEWVRGIELVKRCNDATGCLLAALANSGEHWFVREVAAQHLSRLATGDPQVALEISRAFEVKNPDARVTIALAVSRALGPTRCPRCVDAIETVLEAERGKLPAEMQLAVMTARQVIARIRE